VNAPTSVTGRVTPTSRTEPDAGVHGAPDAAGQVFTLAVVVLLARLAAWHNAAITAELAAPARGEQSRGDQHEPRTAPPVNTPVNAVNATVNASLNAVVNTYVHEAGEGVHDAVAAGLGVAA
jgi:hypothetical protein